MYDCLSLFDVRLKDNIAFLNRAGTLHVSHKYNNSQDTSNNCEKIDDIWHFCLENNLNKVLDNICNCIGLPIPKHRPASTPEVIVYRFMSAILMHSFLGLHKQEWLNGMCDNSGYGSGVRENYFREFPKAQYERDTKRQYINKLNPAYRYWFLKLSDRIPLCVNIEGSCWTKDGKYVDLIALYKKEKRMWPMLNKVAGDFIAIEEK